MFPGGMNPKQLKQMERAMKQMGMNVKELKDVEEVIIKLKDKELVIKNADVSIMNAMGQDTFQVTGKTQERAKSGSIGTINDVIPEEDIDLVISQTGKDKKTVKKVLNETKGDLAEAIMRLS